MGVIQIRQRTERLGNLPGVMRADVRTGGAEALAAQARTMGADGAAARGAVGEAARLVSGAARALGGFFEEREREAADAAVQAYMREKRAEYYGADDGAGNFVAGRLQRGVADPGEYVADARKYDEQLRERHFGGLSKEARERAERAVAGLDLQTQNAVVARAGKEWQARRVSAADEALRLQTQTVLDLPEVADAGMRATAWGAWNDAAERALDVRGVGDAAARRDFRRRNAEALVGAALERRLAEASEAADGAEGAERAGAAFDGIGDLVAENGWRGVIAGDVENERGETVADWLGDDLKESDAEGMRRALAGRVEKARAAAVHRAEAREREARQAVGRDFTERELKLRDTPQELWADAYDEMGRDESLKKAFPERAMAYRDAAAKMREADRKARAQASKDEVEATENGLMGRLLWHIADRANGSVSGDEAAAEQAGIWRDFAVAVQGRAVGAKFPAKFMSAYGRMLNEQQREAMRYTMQLFGLDGRLDSSGRVSAETRRAAEKEGAKFAAPFMETHWYGDERIKAGDLFRLLDEQWRMLDVSDKGVDRLKAAKEVAQRFKEDWLRDGADAVIEGLAEGYMNASRDRLADEETGRGE